MLSLPALFVVSLFIATTLTNPIVWLCPAARRSYVGLITALSSWSRASLQDVLAIGSLAVSVLLGSENEKFTVPLLSGSSCITCLELKVEGYRLESRSFCVCHQVVFYQNGVPCVYCGVKGRDEGR